MERLWAVMLVPEAEQIATPGCLPPDELFSVPRVSGSQACRFCVHKSHPSSAAGAAQCDARGSCSRLFTFGGGAQHVCATFSQDSCSAGAASAAFAASEEAQRQCSEVIHGGLHEQNGTAGRMGSRRQRWLAEVDRRYDERCLRGHGESCGM